MSLKSAQKCEREKAQYYGEIIKDRMTERELDLFKHNDSLIVCIFNYDILCVVYLYIDRV
jgi:hypothetical protein